ncbi:MAG TPA: phage tail protein [Deltaproteobacteria bacterium]|nr:phage tail protein [Deltaproteobacteria bacterium]
MPAAVPAVVSLGTAILASGATSALAKLAIIAAGTALSSAISRSQARSEDSSSLAGAMRGIKANTCSTDEYLPVVYGALRVGGNDVYMAVSGTDNRRLWIVQTLSEGPCEGIVQVDGVDQCFLGSKLYTRYGGNVVYTFHSGTDGQAVDSDLAAAKAEWTDTLRHTSYIVWRLTYDQAYFSSVPSRTVLFKGRLLYDFRTDATAWSDNPVLALYDYVTHARYGMGWAAAKIDIPSWTAAANYCDAKGWKLNLKLTGNEAGGDVIDTILDHFRGNLVWRGGKYVLRYADLNYEASVMSITDEHILRDAQGAAAISIGQPGRSSKPDAVRVTFVDPDKDYATDSFIVGEDDGVVIDLRLPGCTDRSMAGALATYELERARLDRTITLTGRDDCVILEPYDVTNLTSTAMRISGQLMRALSCDLRSDGLVELTLLYESRQLYNDVYDLAPAEVYTCSLPDPDDEPAGAANVVITEETYQYRLRSFTRLKIAFDTPADYPWFSHVEVWISYDNAAWEHAFDAAGDFEIDPVQEGSTYYLRLKAVSIWGRKAADENDYCMEWKVGGYTTRPTSLSSLQAVVNANTINLYASKVSDPDVELYEFRLGSSWAGAIFLGAFRSPNMSLYGVKPGIHTFLVNTLGNNGQYGATPRSATVALIDPPDGWAVQSTQTCDYSSGTHTNTERTTYNSEYYLKCSHTGGVLTGTYLSPVYDLGAVGRYLVYCLADQVVTGAGTTWNSQLPSGATWNSINIATRRWNEIFELAAGPSIAIKLNYGDTSALGSTVERQEILSAIVSGRYFQVEISITDPGAAVNALVEHFTLKFCQ